MARDSLGYEIREGTTSEGGLLLELVVEDGVVARAEASANILHDTHVMLGMSRDDVTEQLKQALLQALRSQGPFVEVTDVVEDPQKPLRFTGRFLHRLRDNVAAGLVWYDVNTSTTGPEELPAVVRNKMRFEVHRKLTEDGSAARALVDLHE